MSLKKSPTEIIIDKAINDGAVTPSFLAVYTYEKCLFQKPIGIVLHFHFEINYYVFNLQCWTKVNKGEITEFRQKYFFAKTLNFCASIFSSVYIQP